MTIYPSIGVGFAPADLFINAAQLFRNNAFIFFSLIPDRPFGVIHHFVAADHPVTSQAQEIIKDKGCWLLRVMADFFKALPRSPFADWLQV
jgi:hypothetical protein